MEIVTGLSTLTNREPAVLTIGAFDGVHLGHQALLHRTAELAREREVRACAVTFWPHPLQVLRPEDPVPLLTTYDQKVAALASLNVLDTLVVEPFTPELAQLAPEGFFQRVWDAIAVRAIVEGPDFAFGKERAGNIAWLRAAGERDGFTVEVLDIQHDGTRVSSSRIRALLLEGAVESATQLLGRPYTLEGMVALGDQRGRLLGFPTANLRLDPAQLVPANGVYAVRVGLAGEDGLRRPGVANIGVRPTFGAENARLVEVHLLDTTLDLYDQPLRVAWVARLRAERRFDGLDALKAQIAADAAQARTLLADPPGDSGTDGWMDHGWTEALMSRGDVAQ